MFAYRNFLWYWIIISRHEFFLLNVNIFITHERTLRKSRQLSISIYLDIFQFLPLWDNVKLHPLVVARQSYSTDQKYDQQNVGEGGSEIYHLSR